MKKYVALLGALMLFLACVFALAEAEEGSGLVNEDFVDNSEILESADNLQEEETQAQPIEVYRVSEIVESEEDESEADSVSQAETAAIEDPDAEDVATATDLGTYNYNELVVGLTAPVNGAFFTDAFSSAAGDQMIRGLIEGDNLTKFDRQTGNYVLDPMVVSGSVITLDEFGNKTYILFLNNDLKYSNGNRITAYDYAFSWLLQLSPEFKAIGAEPRLGSAIYGYEGYAGGITPYLTGVHVLAENVLSVTLKAEALPSQYELGLLSCTPYPISVIAPGCKVYESSVGVYIHNLDRTLIDRQFNADLLKETILGEENGYAAHPAVSSGAYTFAGMEDDQIRLVINQYYIGGEDGIRPSIMRIVFRRLSLEEALEALEKRQIGLLPQVTRTDMIDEGILKFDETDEYSYVSYPRDGMSFISFVSDQKGLDSLSVRKAIALCLDKNAVSEGYVGEHGSRVDGFYGNAQWMIQLIHGDREVALDETAANYEELRTAWDAVNLDEMEVYNLDVNEAVKYLEEDGWILSEEDGIRTKVVDGEELKLDLVLAYPENNTIEDLLEKNFVANLKEAGIRLSLVGLPMDQVMEIYHHPEDRGTDMVYLGRNFNDMFDLTMEFETSDMLEHRVKGTCVVDEELYNRAVDLSAVENGSTLEYMQAWVAFQKRFSEVVPMIPVYSNTYYDFYTSLLHGYNVPEAGSLADGIIHSYMGDYEKVIPVEDSTDLAAENE